MRYGAVITATEMTARMKQVRQLMNIGDMSMAERVIVNFRRAGVADIVMVTGYNADSIEKALRRFDITFIRNENHADAEMIDSARLGLELVRNKCDKVFFCPVDIPFFTDETVTEEMRAMESDSRIKVVVPTCGGRGGHPILIDGSVLPAILAYTGEHGMKGAYDSLPEGRVARIAVDDEGAVIRDYSTADCRKLVDMHNDRILHPNVKVTFASTSRFFGPGTVELLREIDKCGNVRTACEKCGFSYSKGWTIIRKCEEKFGWSIVSRQPGGQTGGSASVTDKGRDLLAAYEELEAELSKIAEERFKELIKKYNLTAGGEK